jgi:hypothetical protein
MTDYYVYSGAAGTADGSSWANAYTTLSAAVTSKTASDRIFVANDHSEANASAQTITFPSSPGMKVLCVNRAGSVPPVAADLTTGALVSCTSTNKLTLRGCAYSYGITYQTGTGNALALADFGTANAQIFEQCALNNGTAANFNMTFGQTSAPNGPSKIELRNSTINLGAASQGLAIRYVDFVWSGGSLAGTSPTNLLAPGNSTQGVPLVDIRNVDLSLVGAACFLINLGNVTTVGSYRLTNCKLSASLGGVTTGSIGGDGEITVDLVNCDNGSGVERQEHYRWAGSTKNEGTIVRSGGASDGTTAFSLKMASNSNASLVAPLVGPDLLVWVDSTGAHTFTVECVTDNVTLTDADFWLDVEYLGDSATPKGTLGSTRANPLASGSPLTTSTATWTTTGLTTPAKQKVTTASLTLNQKGWARVRPVLAKASTTVYVDPAVTVA